jgi:predicted MFS family arabinose efflux permease
MIRGGEPLSLIDFRWAFVVVGVVGVLACLRFLTLRPDAGAEVSGHRRYQGSL